MAIALLAQTKNLDGGLVARGAAGLPFVLYEGLELAVVPPVLDGPRRVTVARVQERSQDEALLWFDEVRDANEASQIVGCELLARVRDIDETVLQEAAGTAWEGWTVIDEAQGEVGRVLHVQERADQPLLVVERPDGREALIPLVEAFLLSVDEAAQVISVDLPAGLLDL